MLQCDFTVGSYSDDIYQFNHNGTATFNGGTVWTSANDGSGSGLDADKLDGQEGSHYLNYNNLSNKPSIVSPTGSGASGTWGINITGSANSANTATDADKVDGIHASSFLRLDQDNTITKSLLGFDTNVSDWGFRFQNASGTNNYVYMAHGAYGMHVEMIQILLISIYLMFILLMVIDSRLEVVMD